MSLLREHLKSLALLLEDRREGIVKRFAPEIVKKWGSLVPNVGHGILANRNRNPEELAPIVIDAIMQADPDPQKRYATWMVQTFVRGQLKLEDLPRLRDAIALYHNSKAAGSIPRSHDLGRIKNLDELYDLVAQFKVDNRTNEIIDQAYARKMDAESQVVMDTPDYEIRIPKTNEAKQWFGRHSEWCTAWGGKYGRHPTKTQQTYHGNLYIITHKPTGTMWQYHRETSQFMDVNDRRVDVAAFTQAHPEVAQFFVEMDMKGAVKIAVFEAAQVFDTGSSIIAAEGFGLSRRHPLISITYSPSRTPGAATPGTIMGASLSYNTAQQIKQDDQRHAAFCDLLKKANLVGNHRDLQDADVAWEKRPGWGRLRDVLPVVVEDEEVRVGKTAGRYYFFTKAETGYDFYLERDTSTKLSNYRLYKETGVTIEPLEYSDIMYKFLKKVNDKNFTIYREDQYTYYDFFDGEMLDRVAKEFPGMVALHIDWKTNGDTPRLRSRIEERLREVNSQWAKEWKGDEVRLWWFEDIHEAIEELGNDTAKWCAKADRGEADFSIDPVVTKEFRSDMLGRLPKAALKEVGEWLLREYPIEAQEWVEANGDTLDVTDNDEINEFIEDYLGGEAAELSECFDSAAYSSAESGTQKEMHDDFVNAIQESGLWFNDNGRWEPGMKWETACAVFASVKQIMDAVGDYSDDDWSNIEWKEELGVEIEVTEPHYGWFGEDEDYGYERFTEELFEKNILTEVGDKAIQAANREKK